MQKTVLAKELKEAIVKKRPILEQLFNMYNGVSVAEYIESASQISSTTDEIQARKQEFIAIFSKMVRSYFGEKIAQSVTAQLQTHYVISTAEHHGPLTHSFFAHSNLFPNAKNVRHSIILSVGNVSLNNSSYPRGLIFHAPNGIEYKLPFFPSKDRLNSVLAQRSFTKNDIVRVFDNIRNLEQKDILQKSITQKLEHVVEQLSLQEKVINQDLYSDQIVYINEQLWKLFPFHSFSTPHMVTIQIEDVVSELILAHHISSQTEIYDLLFSQDMHDKLLLYGDGIPGNFSTAEKKGTFLFWAIPKGSSKRQRLWVQEKKLVSPEGFEVQLEPEFIKDALLNKEIIPSSFLCLLLLSEYYGLVCYGGFSQSTYLGLMKDGYRKMIGKPLASTIEMTQYIKSDFLLAYFKDTLGNYGDASAIDLLLYGETNSWESFYKTAKNVNLEEAMAPLFPELYKILYSEHERKDYLANLQVSDIFQMYQLIHKIEACIILK